MRPAVAPVGPAWKQLAPGMELAYIAAQHPGPIGDSRILVLRIDPRQWEFEFAAISQTGDPAGHTAREWSRRQKFTAVINAGMFDLDYKTHTGYLRAGSHVNNGNVTDYKSVVAFGAKDSASAAPFHIFDLDAPGVNMAAILRDYSSAAQNLRLVKRPGSNAWGQQEKKWSEAALGEDSAGRALFIFSRSPFSMHDLNQELLSAGIGLVAAQHLEGGPEAELYIHAGDVEMEMSGSYETNFNEKDDNVAIWKLPNVLGVRPKAKTSAANERE